tara:strand:- start:20 stop:1465 length:1446 start_codon:yes stop_codon:yes gene_type:complete
MAQTLAGFASILKEFYLGPIQDQLNEETLVCDMFEKASVDWNGRQVIIPVHVARNPSVAWTAEGALLPGNAPPILPPIAPGNPNTQQGYANLTATAQHLYGVFRITGPAMAAAGKGGANSFVGWVDSEMNRLVTDVKNQCNRSAVSGGQCIGFITYADINAGVVGGLGDLIFDGDAAKLAAVIAAGGLNHVDLVPMGTDTGGGGATAYDAFAGGATLTVGATAGTVNVTGGATGAGFPVDAAGNGIPLAVVVNTVAAAPFAVNAQEPVGIYGNLGLSGVGAVAGQGGAWFGLDRSTNTGTAVPMQCSDGAGTSNALSGVTTTGGAAGTTPARVNISLQILQSLLDRITIASDESPDVLLVNPLQRTRLAAMLQGTLGVAGNWSQVMDVKSKPTTGDGGFTGFAFAGIPVKTSRHVDNGLCIALSTKSWKMLELEAGKFADEDGNVLSRVIGADAFEGFYKWYYNIVCVRPNSNGLLTGLTL